MKTIDPQLEASKGLQIQNMKILIVEDSPTQSEMLLMLLEEVGYRVTVAVNGKAALTLLQEQRPDMIISDITMPEMDGYTLCREIKAREDLQEIPVILLTTLSDPHDVISGLQCGADNFITKPYEPDYLLNQIWSVLINRELRKTARTEMGFQIFFANQKFLITAEKQQILDMLLSTYEVAVQKNLELEKARTQLRQLNDQLECKVIERTAELTAEMAERKLLEEQYRQAQKMEAVGRLTGGIAHDFNNLLTVILAFSDILLRKAEADTPQHKQLKEIRKAGERAAALISQLLAFSRKQVVQPRVLELNEVIADVEQILRPLIGEDIDLVTILAPDLGRVQADQGQIDQIIMNLAVNARDAMPLGGVLSIETANVELDKVYTRLHVEVPPGSYVMLAVSDTGCGMDSETRAHLFEPFFTTKEQGKGTGLGLATVFGIVEQNRGHIWVYSEPEQGTAFKIYLPRVELASAPVELGESQPAQLHGSETILVAEDDQALRSLVCDLLEGAGYRVLVGCQGEETLQVAERHQEPLHLLLTDVVMPKMGGSELVKRLAPLHPETRVLYMSGYTDNTIAQHGILRAGIAFLQKPFTEEGLLRKVREVLDGPRASGP